MRVRRAPSGRDRSRFAAALVLFGLFLAAHSGGSRDARRAGSHEEAQVSWTQRSLGDAGWEGHTIAVAERRRVLFLHQREVTIFSSGGRFMNRRRGVLAMKVTPQTAAIPGPGRSLFLAGGPDGEVFRISTTSWKIDRLPGLDALRDTTVRLALGPRGALYAVTGRRRDNFWRLEGSRWVALPDAYLVTRFGKFSAGFYPTPGGFLAFGDHHLGYYDLASGAWPQVHVGVLGIRPALDRGGMSARHPETGDLYFTLGKGSNTLGRATTDESRKLFRYLSPRLPLGLGDSGETLFFTRSGKRAVLNLVSAEHGVWLSIPAADLTPVSGWTGPDDGWQWTTAGELVREKDSIANMVHVPPHVYVQRKNLVRRFHLGSRGYSKNEAGFLYGSKFIKEGAAAIFDGSRKIFLYTGRKRDFYALHLRERSDGQPNAGDELLEIEDMAVSVRSSLPEPASGNTAFAWAGDELFALFNTTSRRIHRYHAEADRWDSLTTLPEELPYHRGLGADLLVDGGRLLLLSGSAAASFDLDARRWTVLPALAFSYSSDGGMAAADLENGRLYVILGGSTRDLGVVCAGGGSYLLEDELPDLVSVYGKRAWIAESGGRRYLYVFRGHDSNELWRHALPLGTCNRRKES